MTRSEAIEWFKNSPFYDENHEPLNMAIKALQGDMYCPNCGVRLVQKDEYIEPTQTHGRLIDAYALMKELSDIQPCNWTESEAEIQEDADYSLFKSLINSAPTVQADRPHGEWVQLFDNTWECTNCEQCEQFGEVIESTSDFCPNCGADMRGGDTE